MREITDLVLEELRRLQAQRDQLQTENRQSVPLLVAIDGRCASGKTTLAEALRQELSCNIFHMDDFFLQKEQRTTERLAEPGGNVDRERFLAEVLQPLSQGQPFSYRPFDCHTFAMGEPVSVIQGEISIVEGSYSCHPELRAYYDLTIFLTTDPQTQLRRLSEREGADLQAFREKWIPMEERYIAACGVQEHCDLVFGT